MQLMPPNRSQLVPPRISNTLHRGRLKPLGLAMLEHRVSTVVGPAGFGKSVWVSSLTEEPGWPATAWISIDGSETEPAAFMSQLIHAMRTVRADFGDNALKTMTSLESAHSDWPSTMAAFVNDLPLQTETVMVVDDFHLMHDQPVIVAILEYLVKWMPGTMHLIIISRYEPQLKLGRYKVNGEILSIDINQLMFTRAEAGELLALMEIHPSPETLDWICEMTEGWPVCLRLSAIVMKQMGGQALWPPPSARNMDQSLHEYLGHEMLLSIPAPLKEFLLSASLLPYIDASLCDAAFQTEDSAEKIGRLQADGLLAQIADISARWRMHHLIKEYLLITAQSEFPLQTIRKIKQLACKHLEGRGDIEQALEIACGDADWPRAVDLIRRHGYDFYSRNGCLEMLYKWVARLPEEMIEDDPWLLFLKGRSMLQLDNQEAVAILIAAADLANKSGDLRCEAYCLLALNYAQVQTGDGGYSGVILSRMKANPALQRDSLSYGAALSVALGNAIYDDNIREGSLICRQALKLPLDAEVRMSVCYGAAIMAHRSGQLDRARQFCHQALEMPFVKANERWAVSGYLIESTVLYLMGDWNTSEAVCRKAQEICLKYDMLADSARLHRNLARVLLRQGRLTESRIEYELACAGFANSDSASYLTHVSVEMAMLRLVSGESPGELLAETRELVRELQGCPVGQGGDQNAQCILATMAIQAGELDEARVILEGLVKHDHEKGDRYLWAGTGLILAYVLWLQGHDKKCDRILRKALVWAQANNWQNFWEWYDPVIYAMYRRAIEMNIQTEWALQNLLRWFPQTLEGDAGQYLAGADERLRSMTAAYLRDQAAQSGKTLVHTCYLNGFRVFINGQEVEKASWATQKAEILCKILLYERRPQNKDALIERLWPDNQLGDASLRMALSQIRKVMKAHGATPECILVRNRTVALHPDLLVYADYECFESEARRSLEYARANPNHGIRKLRAAADKYPGPLLPEDAAHLRADGRMRHLQDLYLQILKTLAGQTEWTGQINQALELCTSYLRLEPADEEITRMAMEMSWRKGQKSKALALYRNLVNLLDEEYNVLPEEATMALFDQIRQAASSSRA